MRIRVSNRHTNYQLKLGFARSLLLVCAAMFLSGCESVRNTFGLDHYQPNEFNVSNNPPLSLPKDYRLRPPSSKSEQASSIPQQQTIFRDDPTHVPSDGKVETQFLSQVLGKEQADPSIRKKIDEEAGVATDVPHNIVQKIMNWPKKIKKNLSTYEKPDEQARTNQPSS